MHLDIEIWIRMYILVRIDPFFLHATAKKITHVQILTLNNTLIR